MKYDTNFPSLSGTEYKVLDATQAALYTD